MRISNLACALLLAAIGTGCGSSEMETSLPDMEAMESVDLGAPDMAKVDPCASVTCSGGYICRGGVCEIDRDVKWVLTVTNGQFVGTAPDGSAWDPFGGSPDPYVCLTFAGVRKCTAYKDNTLSPIWNEAFSPTLALNLLGGILVEVWDYDTPDPDDQMCAKIVVPVTQDNFNTGRWSASCSYGTIHATLRIQ